MGGKEEYYEMEKSKEFFSDLIQATMQGNMSKIKSLLENRSDEIGDVLKGFQSEGKTIFHIAASSGKPMIMKYFLDCLVNATEREVIVNTQDKDGYNPLMYATISESSDCMEECLRCGANVNLVNNNGCAPIHFAAADGNIERLKLLHTHKADMSIISKYGTAIHWAAGKGRTKAIEYLLTVGIDINARDENGTTAVIAAACAGSDDSCVALLEAGASMNDIISGNLSLLHICSENGLQKSIETLLTLPEGASLFGIKTDDGENLPIHLAAMNGKRNIVEKLFEISKPFLSPSLTTIDDVMIDGVERMKIWEEKNTKKKTEEKEVHVFNMDTSQIAPAINDDAAHEAELFKLQGNNFFKKKKYEEAIEAYTNAISKQGDKASYWSNRSACYLAMKKYDQALYDAEVCRRLDSTWPKGCFRLAAARMALGMYEDAAVAAFEGCKLDERNEELKSMLREAVAKGQQEYRSKT